MFNTYTKQQVHCSFTLLIFMDPKSPRHGAS